MNENKIKSNIFSLVSRVPEGAIGVGHISKKNIEIYRPHDQQLFQKDILKLTFRLSEDDVNNVKGNLLDRSLNDVEKQQAIIFLQLVTYLEKETELAVGVVLK